MKLKKLASFFLSIFLFFSAFGQNASIEFIEIEGGKKINIGTNKYFYYKDYYKESPSDIAFYYPEKKIQLESYKISKYLIDDKLFNQFIVDTGIKIRSFEEYTLLNKYFNKNKNSHKIFGFACYYESLCFSQWLSEKYNKIFRFPTNAEWEYACMEDDKKIYPFGAPDGKFESVIGEEDTRCIFLDCKQVKEDYSSKGVCSVYGAKQYVLDSFGDKLYSDFPEKIINPLMLSESEFFNVRSGEWEYNSKNKAEWGLLATGNETFYPEYGSSYIAIRLVDDEGTVFNKNSDTPFTFFQSTCRLKTNIDNLQIPFDKDILILYKTLDGMKYYILYKIGENWHASWEEAKNFRILDKKWYEINID